MSLLLVPILVLAALRDGCSQSVDSQANSGFPSLDEVRGNGSMLVNTTTHEDIGTVLFPGMNFSCNGRITKLTFLAVQGVIRTSDLEFFLGKPTPQGAFTMDTVNASTASLIGGSGTGYELKYEVEFQAGDVLSVYQVPSSRHHLLHQMNEVVETCTLTGDKSRRDNNCTIHNIGRPLVAVETDHPECVNGFIDRAALSHVMAATELISHPGKVSNQRVGFNCNRTTLTNWTVGARIMGNNYQNAGQIIIRTTNVRPSQLPSTTVLRSLNVTSYLNVYEYELDDKIFVRQDQYIAVNSTQIYYQHCGLMNSQSGRCIDRPLVVVDADCQNRCSECTRGFIGMDELREKARYIPNFAEVEHQYIPFPHLNITQDGYLVKWIFTAEDLGRGEGRTQYPQLLILPPNSTNFGYNGINNYCSTSDRVHCLNSSQSVATEYLNVYEYTVDPPLPVETGYFIAIYQPPRETARMLLSFVKRAPPGTTIDLETEHDSNSKDFFLQPLVNLKINTTVQPSVPTSEGGRCSGSDLLPSCPSTATMEYSSPPSSGSETGAVIGGVVAVVALTVIIAALVVILVLLVRRKQGKVQVSGQLNPFYMEVPAESTHSRAVSEPQSGGGTDSHVYAQSITSTEGQNRHTVSCITPIPPSTSPLPHTATEPHVYTEPSTSNKGQNGPTITHTAPSPPSSSPPPHTATETQEFVYAQPHVTRTSQSVEPVSNPEYFYTQPHIEGHYEFAVYVPTKEQREHPTVHYHTLEQVETEERNEMLTFFEECNVFWKPAPDRESLYAQLSCRKYREIPSHQIRITEHLGSGQFGTVNRGVWQGGGQAGVEVAVKMLQEGTSELDTVRFLQEAAINGQFRHPNIVQLLGVVTVGKPVMIVTELAQNGDLRTYLLSTFSPDSGEPPQSDTAALLAQFCVQVARGMDYLSSKAFVHRDLAARNILITEDKTCKISDFGMSRDLAENSYYMSTGGQIPVKWTAPEAIHLKKYSTANDVWSFGCLMYEIWSLGHKPFEGFTNPETIVMIDEGKRLAPPPGCPLEMYCLMITCWNSDKSGRPQFREIVQTLSQSEDELLFIPEVVTRGHPQASILGAPLEAGRDLYTQLQNTYIH